MAGTNEKRRQLDDEMSRFEAEISGVPKLSQSSPQLPPPPQALGPNRPIIGSNTFRQVQQQLRQTTPDAPSHPHPPEPPSTTKNGPAPQENLHERSGPPPLNDRPQNVFRGQPDRGPPDVRPRICGTLAPPPPPPFLTQSSPRGGPNFPPRGFAPPPPPGFVPPQVNRAMGGPMMGPGQNMGPPRHPGGFLPPPPPPPGLLHQGPHLSKIFSGGPTFNKPATIISSAPKLYTKESPEEPVAKPQPEVPILPLEPRKKKQKVEHKPSEPPLQSSITHAQEMAEKVKQSIITTKVSSGPNSSSHNHSEDKKKERKPRKNLRYAGGQVWEDNSLNEWDPDDFRMFAGDLGNDVTDDLLHRYFSHFGSFVKAKVVRDKRTNKSKGYGFISFRDPQDYIRAMKEMNGKYVGSRPIKLRKSSWRDRALDVVQKKMKEKQMQGLK